MRSLIGTIRVTTVLAALVALLIALAFYVNSWLTFVGAVAAFVAVVYVATYDSKDETYTRAGWTPARVFGGLAVLVAAVYVGHTLLGDLGAFAAVMLLVYLVADDIPKPWQSRKP
jgi:hypothetical protein